MPTSAEQAVLSTNAKAILAKWGGGGAEPPSSNADAILKKWGGTAQPKPDNSIWHDVSRALTWLNAPNAGEQRFVEQHPVMGAPLRFLDAAGAAAEALPGATYEQFRHPVESIKQTGQQAKPLREDIRNYEATHPELTSTLGGASVLPAIGHEFYEGYKAGVLPEALGTGTGTALGGEAMGRVTGPLKDYVGEAAKKIPALHELSKSAIASKSAPGLEAAGNEVRSSLSNALSAAADRHLPLDQIQNLNDKLGPLISEDNSAKLFKSYRNLSPEQTNAIQSLHDAGFLDKGRIDQLSDLAGRVERGANPSSLPWKLRLPGYMAAGLGLYGAQAAGLIPKTPLDWMLRYGIGMGGTEALVNVARRISGARALEQLPELERPNLAPPPEAPILPPVRRTGEPLPPLSEAARLRQAVPLELQAQPNERPFETILSEIENDTRPPRGGSETEAKLRSELEKTGQMAREKARTQEALRHTATQIEAATPGIAEKTALPEEIRGSAPKPSGRLILSPEEARTEERMQRIAEKRASQHGMLYAAGMRPEGGGRVPFTPTRTFTEEYRGPREAVSFAKEVEGILPKVEQIAPRVASQLRSALKRLSPAAD